MNREKMNKEEEVKGKRNIKEVLQNGARQKENNFKRSSRRKEMSVVSLEKN